MDKPGIEAFLLRGILAMTAVDSLAKGCWSSSHRMILFTREIGLLHGHAHSLGMLRMNYEQFKLQ
jgi:hypothetical protein